MPCELRNEAMRRVLAVEPAETIAIPLRFLLEEHEFAVDVAASTDEVAALDLSKYAALIIDVKPGSTSTLDLIARLHREQSHLVGRIVAMSSSTAEEVVAALEALGVCDVVPKPLNAEDIVRAVLDCIEHSPQFNVQ